MQTKLPRRPVNGVLLLDKPLGFSSNQALQKVKWLYQAIKAGHSGTLDPLATGLLPICLGEATKFAQVLTDAPKTYIADVLFGVTTSTGDAEGEVLHTQVCDIQSSVLNAVLPSFLGKRMQTPPMYSALKLNGKPLYAYARAGIDVARTARPIEITELTLIAGEANRYQLNIGCSKGTYIRTLAEEIGLALGVGAHLRGLRRTQTAHYRIQQAMTIAQLEALNMMERDVCLLPVDTTLSHLPAVTLPLEAERYFRQGQAVWAAKVQQGNDVRAYNAQARFLGLADVLADGRIAPKRLVNL